MENNLHDIDLIQRYFDRSLNEGEKEEMQRRLSEEPALKSMYEEMELLVSGIRYSHMKDKLDQLRLLESSLTELGTSQPNGKSVMFAPVWKPVAMAASLLLVATVGYFMWSGSPTNEQLFASHFQVFDSPGADVKRGSNLAMPLLGQAYEAYDAGNYAEAAKLFERVIPEKDDAIAHICLGNAYLAMGNTARAKESFTHIIEKHGELITQAKWYLALTFLKENNVARTKSILWELSNAPYGGEEAKRLLEKLE